MKLNFDNVDRRILSCERRTLDQPQMRWPDEQCEFSHENNTYVLRPMRRADVPTIVSLYRNLFPDLYRSNRHFLFEESYFNEEAAAL